MDMVDFAIIIAPGRVLAQRSKPEEASL